MKLQQLISSGMRRLNLNSVIWLLVVIVVVSVPLKARANKHQLSEGTILDRTETQRYAELLSKMPPPAYGKAPTQASGTVMVESQGVIYITSEAVQAGSHLPSSGAIEFYTEGNLLHIRDGAGKDHPIEVVRVLKAVPPATQAASARGQVKQELGGGRTDDAYAASMTRANSTVNSGAQPAKAAPPSAAIMPTTAPAAAPQAPVAAAAQVPVNPIARVPAPAPVPAQTPRTQSAVAATRSTMPAPAPTVAPVSTATTSAVTNSTASAAATAQPVAAPTATPAIPEPPPLSANPVRRLAPAPPAQVATSANASAPAPVWPASRATVEDASNTQAQPLRPLPPMVGSQLPSQLVVIESTPSGADVQIDLKTVGTTPYISPFPRGVHQVTLIKSGFSEWMTTVSISETELHLHANLEQQTASK